MKAIKKKKKRNKLTEVEVKDKCTKKEVMRGQNLLSTAFTVVSLRVGWS
jgi:hypothetical protein